MANDANILKRGSGSDAYIVPELWSEQIEQIAREKNIMLGLSGSVIIDNRAGSGSGDTINIAKNTALSAAAVTDGNSIGISALSFNTVTVAATIKGVAVQLTLKQLRDSLSGLEQDVIANLGEALALKEEADIISTLQATSSTGIYPGTKTSSTIASTDVLDVATFNKAAISLRTSKRQPMYYVIHPKQEGDMRVLQGFLDASYYGSDAVRRTGEIGTFLGVKVFSTTNIATATENSVTVYKSLMVGPRAAVFYIRQAPTFEMNRNLIQDLSIVMQAWEDYGVARLNEESIRVVTTA